MAEEFEPYLCCEECGLIIDDPEAESLVKGDRCPECNEGYLMEV